MRSSDRLFGGQHLKSVHGSFHNGHFPWLALKTTHLEISFFFFCLEHLWLKTLSLGGNALVVWGTSCLSWMKSVCISVLCSFHQQELQVGSRADVGSRGGGHLVSACQGNLRPDSKSNTAVVGWFPRDGFIWATNGDTQMPLGREKILHPRGCACVQVSVQAGTMFPRVLSTQGHTGIQTSDLACHTNGQFTSWSVVWTDQVVWSMWERAKISLLCFSLRISTLVRGCGFA